MKMKRALLASTALALFAVAQEAQANSLYISVLGGANWQEDSSSIDFDEGSTLSMNIDPDTGFVVGAAFGTHLDNWIKGLRGELEMTYRRSDAGGNFVHTTFYDGTTTGIVDANLSNFAIMANAWYDFNVASKLRAYVGGGAGWARAKMDGALASYSGYSSYAQFSNETTGFAYQLGIGLAYPVADGVEVGIGYRYFNGPNFRVFVDPIFSGKNSPEYSQKFENDSHGAMLHLKINMN